MLSYKAELWKEHEGPLPKDVYQFVGDYLTYQGARPKCAFRSDHIFKINPKCNRKSAERDTRS